MNCFDPKLTLHSTRAAPAVGWTLEVRWRSLQRAIAHGSPKEEGPIMRMREFIARVALLSHDRCVIETWIECDGRRKPALAAHLSPVICSFHEDIWHVDVFDAPKRATRLLALSIECDDGGQPSRLWYVQTPLLATSGFAGGSCDRPALFATRTESINMDSMNIVPINGKPEITAVSDARRHNTVIASA